VAGSAALYRPLRVAAQQDDPPLGELLSVVTQPYSERRKRKLDVHRQGDRFKTLAWRRGHDIKPCVHDEQRCSRGRGCRQIAGPPEREITRAGQSYHKHDVEARPCGVAVRGHLARRKRVPEGSKISVNSANAGPAGDLITSEDPAARTNSWPDLPGHGLRVVRRVADRMQKLSGPSRYPRHAHLRRSTPG
jgi:hypothetical protein